jgi:ABC-type dipeptide/oligopeptide/nickel transport system permease component
VSLLTFGITRAAGEPWTAYLQNPERATPQQIADIKEKYHLNDPLWEQYVYWLKGVSEGDLGFSSTAKMPVTEAMATKFTATFELALLATFFSVIIGIFVGTISAVRANSAVDQGSRLISLIGVSIPVFWFGLMLLMLFYRDLGWLPGPTGRYDVVRFHAENLDPHTGFLTLDTLLNGKFAFFWDVVRHLILPAMTLAFTSTAIIIRMMRSSMLEVLGAEYVKTARSKGLPERVVINRHARRNALIPTTTVVGLSFGGLLGGAVLTETIFNWNGLGQWSGAAATNLDTAAIMGFTLLTAVIYVLANLVVDVVYAYLDPRVRLG